MKSFRSVSAAVLLSGLMAACGRSDDAVKSPLAYVPADTPYVFANIERMPTEVTDAWLALLEPMGEGMRQSVARARERMVSDSASDEGRVTLALLELAESTMSVEGWRRIGMRTDTLAAIYGVGIVPVLRMDLADPDAFRAFVADIERRAETTAPMAEVEGQSYWRFPLGKASDEDAGGEFAVVLAVIGDHLVATMDFGSEPAELAALLGLRAPTRNLAESGELEQVNRRLGLGPHGTLLVDTRRLLAALLDDAGPLGRRMARDAKSLSPECRREFEGFAEVMPRMISGYSQLDTSRMVSDSLFELREDLARGLMPLAAPVPGLGRVDEAAVLDFGFSMKLDKLAEFVQAQASAIRAEPYTCEHLASLNESAQQVGQQLAGLYMAAGWFTGMRFALTGLVWPDDAEMPTEFEGAFVLASPSPSGLIGMVRGFVPALADLDLSSDAPPQRVDPRQFGAEMVPEQMPPMFAAVREQALGIGFGEAAAARLPDQLTAPAGEPLPLLYVGYDGATYGRLMQQFESLGKSGQPGASEASFHDMVATDDDDFEYMPAPEGGTSDLDYVMEPFNASMAQVYQRFGYSWMNLFATERGLELRQEMQLRRAR